MTLHQTHAFRLRAIVLVFALLFCVGAQGQGVLGLFGRGQCEVIVSGGHRLTVERFDPPGVGRHPAVIVLHGFDGTSRHGYLYRRAGHLLARNGYCAYLVHYFDGTRGAPPSRIIDPQEFALWMQNVTDVINYVEAQPNVDPQRIGVVGFSLGAFVALSVTSDDPRVRVLVEFAGGMPARYARRVKSMPPTMIIHGDADTVIPLTEAFKLEKLLISKNTPYQMAIYPGQGHIFDSAGKKDLTWRIRDFLLDHLPASLDQVCKERR